MRPALPARRPTIVLTGGPGGGKSALIADVLHDPALAGRLVVLPEAVRVALGSSVLPRDPAFQRLIVCCQRAIEDAVDRALGPDDPRALLTHRGTLDPLAFCLTRGWSETEWLTTVGLDPGEEMTRYAGVLHLVSYGHRRAPALQVSSGGAQTRDARGGGPARRPACADLRPSPALRSDGQRRTRLGRQELGGA